MRCPRVRTALLAACAVLPPAAAVDRPYDFVIKPQQSGLSGEIAFTVGTSGTLIGNHDPASNPTGTRTKPGLFGPFGETENVAVPTSLSAGLGGDVNSRTAGGFRLTLNPEAGTVGITEYNANFISSGPLGLPITVGLSFDTFRTRSPTFLYLGGTLNLPLGSADVTAFSAAQTGPAGLGVLTAVGPDEYSFFVPFVADLAASVSLLGNPFDLPPTPLPMVLAGTVTLDGQGGAVLESMQPLELMTTQNPDLMLPQFAFDLPTLNPDDPAHVLFDLTLDELGFGVDATVNLVANGVLVPEPAGGLALVVTALFACRRRSFV